jgi:phosphate-selective porin OprO/OprP
MGWAVPAQAQSADTAAIQQELATMRAQMQQMAQRIDTLEGQLATANAKADEATAAVAKIPAPTATAKPATEVTWDGAPKFSAPVDPKNPSAGTWSFKPRGRLQIDTAGVNAPSGLVDPNSSPANNPVNKDLGIATEFRRAYIGFDGTIPGGFGYRLEADLAGSSVNLTDLYLTYKASPEVTITVGQYKPYWGLEELTSDLFTSFMERAAFSTAFGYERRVGLGAAYTGKDFLAQGGVFTDDAASLNSDRDNSFSIDGRLVYFPKIGSGQLHLGASAHYRQFNDLTTTPRYSTRPFVHTTDVRFVDTVNQVKNADGEHVLALEGAYILGRFHASAESSWLTATRQGFADPTFNGGYAEVGYLLTNDTTAYKAGVYDRIRPSYPVGKGGIGAIQLNARYDWLDLNDAGIIGGRQQIAGASMLWIPTDYVRFILNYGHLWINDSAIPAGTDRNYQADSMGLRAQFDF